MPLTTMLGEYFFGTETHKEYERQRNFYREHEPDASQCRSLITRLDKEERLFTFYGKVFPNLELILGMTCAATTSTAVGAMFIAAAEYGRYICSMSLPVLRYANQTLREAKPLENQLREQDNDSTPGF